MLTRCRPDCDMQKSGFRGQARTSLSVLQQCLEFLLFWGFSLKPRQTLGSSKRGHYERGSSLEESWGCAKGAEASCRETVVQKGVFGESVSSLSPLRFALKTSDNLKGAEKKRTLQKHPFAQPFLRMTPSPLLWHARISKISKFSSRILLRFPHLGGSLESLDSLHSLESLENA